MRHFLFGKDLYQNSQSQISPILSYYDFFQVGFSIKLMLIFFNKNFIRVIITFKIQLIHTGTTCPSREIHDEITVLFVRDFHSWWRLQRVTHAYCMPPGYAILSGKKIISLISPDEFYYYSFPSLIRNSGTTIIRKKSSDLL